MVRWTGTFPLCGDGWVLTAPVSRRTVRAAPIAAVLASMTGVQIGAALSVPLFATFGVAGTTWLRLTFAAVVLAVVLAPGGRLPRLGRRDLPAGALGVVMACNTVAFSAATDRIPLGVAVAIEFTGPLSLAALGSRGGGVRRAAWPLLALAGVVTLTRPWTLGGATTSGTWLGLVFAAAAGAGWAAYIVLTAHVGRRSEGFGGLSLALTVAAVVLAPAGVAQAWPGIRAAATGQGQALGALLTCGLAALLVPLAAYALEMTALRHLDRGVFGVWMALEPAIGALVGLLLLAQHPTLWQWPGFGLVVAAGIGAQRAAGRSRRPTGPGRAGGSVAGELQVGGLDGVRPDRQGRYDEPLPVDVGDP
jgi:inner membrane transporter RhtA